MKKFIGTVVIVIILILAGFLLAQLFEKDYEPQVPEEVKEEVVVEPEPEIVPETETLVTKSAEGRDITAFRYGEGNEEILFVGGIHGGYDWNTVLLSYRLMDYLEENPEFVPENLKVTVIPVLNPDGLNRTVGSSGRFQLEDIPDDQDELVAGRFNANGVDLNRNFDCEWQEVGIWQSREVDGGEEPFSEPETLGLKNYIEKNNPRAVVTYYAAAGGVFASNCHDGVLKETTTLTNLYAKASGYKAFEDFDFYEVTGDAVNWMASQGTPAISVLLSTHQTIEWDQNKDGIEAILEYYAQ